MAYNRPDPQVHHWFIPQMYLWYADISVLTRIFTLFAIFFMQLWGVLPACTLPSPISTLGHGFRSSIKPDLLFPGGRQLFEHEGNGTYRISQLPHGPGQKVAAAPVNEGEISRTVYTRGTSREDAGSLDAEVPYGLAISLEVKQNVDIPIYEEIQQAIEISTRVKLSQSAT